MSSAADSSVESPLAESAGEPSTPQAGQRNGSISRLSPAPASEQSAKNSGPVKAKAGTNVSTNITPSGKELKERAKAEKAAKRAKEKQGRQGQPVVDLQGGNQPENASPVAGGKVAPFKPEQNGTKPHHRRKSSAGANISKGIPHRPAERDEGHKVPEPRKEQIKQVPLFEHLYTHPRRNTISGTTRDIHPMVMALGLQLSSYQICGSSARCVATLMTFKQVIAGYTTPAGTSLPRHLTTYLATQIDYLISCRPLSTSQGNAIRWLKVTISAIDVQTAEDTAKADLGRAIDDFIHERITVADQVISATACEQIRDDDVILTYAKSSVVERTLAEAWRQGRNFRVIVIDSGPLFEGANLAESLAEVGIEVQYAETPSLSCIISSATKVILGAHAIMINGSLYSRIGTALVALSAKNARIPIMVCCESIKFSDKVATDSFMHNELAPPEEVLGQQRDQSENDETDPNSLAGLYKTLPDFHIVSLMYDLTPAHHIDMIVSEYGALPPSSVPAVLGLDYANLDDGKGDLLLYEPSRDLIHR